LCASSGRQGNRASVSLLGQQARYTRRRLQSARGNAYRRNRPPPDAVRPVVLEEARLRQRHRHRVGRPNRLAERDARVGVQPRRDVHRHDGASRPIHGVDRCAQGRAEFAACANPQQRVHQQVFVAEQRGVGRVGQRQRRDAIRLQDAPLRRRVAAKLVGAMRQPQMHLRACLVQVPRDDHPVPAVVALARQHRHTLAHNRREPLGDALEHAVARALHQHQRRDAVFFDGGAV
jgi:hypothetical protein